MSWYSRSRDCNGVLGPGGLTSIFDGFFPLLDDVLGLLIKVDVGTKH
jgi:hypothetical protein